MPNLLPSAIFAAPSPCLKRLAAITLILGLGVVAPAMAAPVVRYALGALLLLGVGFAFYGIEMARRNLERRVADRTNDLQAEVVERRRTEVELLDSKIFLQSSLDALSAHIAMLDATGTIVAVNATWRKFAEANGGREDSLGIGASYLAVCERATGACSTEAAVVAAGIRRVMAGEVPEFQHEYPCHSPWEERWFVVRITRFFSEGSLYMMVAHENVTARTQAECSVQTQQAELRLLSSAVAQSTESIVITDADLDSPGPRIVFVNPAFTKMTGYPAEEALGQSPRKMQGPRTDQSMLRQLRQTLERGQSFTGEGINYRKDGTEYVVEWQIAPIRNAAEKITHFVAIQRDITERKRAENELADMHQQLVVASRQAGMAEVATGVLHNVGNVLNSVNVSSTLVADTVRKSKIGNLQRVVALLDTHAADLGAFVSSDPHGKNLPAYLRQLHERLQQEQKTVLAEVEALRGNIDHIKDIVAMQQSYATYSGVTEVVELSALVEDALRMNSSSLHRHDIQVVREFEKIPCVSVDKHKLLQILVNLVRNAKQACDDSGQTEKLLTFRVSNGHEHVRVAVTDNGVGISPENLTRIFAHGFTTKKGGHGFGLHSSALAAREMGGSLRAQSDGPGRGATFTVELPLAPSQPPAGENSYVSSTQ